MLCNVQYNYAALLKELYKLKALGYSFTHQKKSFLSLQENQISTIDEVATQVYNISEKWLIDLISFFRSLPPKTTLKSE